MIVGTCGTSALELALTKFNRDGTLTPTFGRPVAHRATRPSDPTTNESGNAVKQRAADIKMQADGRFLVQCGYFRTSSWSQCLYRVNSDGTVATSFSSGLPFPSEPGRVVYNAIGDALAFAITPVAAATPTASSRSAIGDGVGGYTGGTSCVTAVRNGTGAASADGTIDGSLIGPNGDQLGTFTFRTRGLPAQQRPSRNRRRWQR